MTRFARAKGSKSSNEKVPEEATPWSRLKKGMLTKQKAVTEETKKCVSALKLKTEDKPTEWVSLDNEHEDSLSILKKHLQKQKRGKSYLNDDDKVVEESLNTKEPKRKWIESVDTNIKRKDKQVVEFQEGSNTMLKKRKNKIGKKIVAEDQNTMLSIQRKKKKMDPTIADDDTTGRKKQKRKNTNDRDEPDQDCVKEKTVKKRRKLDKTPEDNFEGDKEKTMLSKKKKGKIFAGKKLEKKTDQSGNANKLKKSKNNKRKFINDKMTINIGGEKVKLVKFQGFYVTEEDSERLKELRKKMKDEGIPQNQIEGAIKLERRRCEKALARMKKNVCFQCRKPGHVLSQCPEVQESVDTTTGVCYKCGSTEHKAFHCKVTKGQKFPFAECFICKEKGHIARECPDNPRGLYPKGGCCKLCGDVTHLKKDCPKRISETEEKTIRLGMVDQRNLEGLDDGCVKIAGNGKKQKKKPVVHF